MVLENVRDSLKPALREEEAINPELAFDIQIDTKTDALIIKGYNTLMKRSLGFAITNHSIVEGLYKESFGPSLNHLVKLLLDPSLDMTIARFTDSRV